MAGAFPVAYALSNFRRETVRELLRCFLTAGALGCGFMVVLAFLNGAIHLPTWSNAGRGCALLLQTTPASFVVEEVWFRGVLDSHLHRPGEPRGFFSAVYGSALWGVWHFPISGAQPDLQSLLINLGLTLLTTIAIGTLLARAWQSSKNLAVPAIVHCFVDAFGQTIA